jgi:lambda repressor-like predicted transcriptional regulator
LVHSVDQCSNKSDLMPPGLDELAKLAQQTRMDNAVPSPIEPTPVPSRSLRRRLTPHVIEELVTRYIAGETIRALSRTYDVSRSGLRTLLQREGVVLREYGITPEVAEKAVQLYERGLTIRKAAAQVGHSYGTIREVLHQHGVVLRVGGRRIRQVPDE